MLFEFVELPKVESGFLIKLIAFSSLLFFILLPHAQSSSTIFARLNDFTREYINVCIMHTLNLFGKTLFTEEFITKFTVTHAFTSTLSCFYSSTLK